MLVLVLHLHSQVSMMPVHSSSSSRLRSLQFCITIGSGSGLSDQVLVAFPALIFADFDCFGMRLLLIMFVVGRILAFQGEY